MKPRFTLLELLVVMLVISILMTMLMPSLARAREKAKRTSCMVNQKNIGLSLRSYAIDESGWFPTAHTERSSDTGEDKKGLDRLVEELYLTADKIYYCPSGPRITWIDEDDHIVDPAYIYLVDSPENPPPIFSGEADVADSSVASDKIFNHTDTKLNTSYGNITYHDGRVLWFIGLTWYEHPDVKEDLRWYIINDPDL
ncbi:MAG: type II secretory pathway pseudopilin PulG [Rhodothermales bacterium]|jgi:type II secretory pathway pseudopilin PulG